VKQPRPISRRPRLFLSLLLLILGGCPEAGTPAVKKKPVNNKPLEQKPVASAKACGKGAWRIGGSCLKGLEVERAILRCQQGKRCPFRMASAPKSAEDCRKADDCRVFGACNYSPRHQCFARTDAECRKSIVCLAGGGRCFAADGSCGLKAWAEKTPKGAGGSQGSATVDCRSSYMCTDQGLCSPKATSPGSCKATLDADCRKSKDCRSKGRCSVGRGHCQPASDADCRRSTACKTDGLCKKRGSLCSAGSDADCKRSTLCKRHGHCKMVVAVSLHAKNPKQIQQMLQGRDPRLHRICVSPASIRATKGHK
jgi:hypothetical protein